MERIDKTKSHYYKVHLTKQQRYIVRKEARRLTHAKDYKQADEILRTIQGRQGVKRTLNQRQKRKRIRWAA